MYRSPLPPQPRPRPISPRAKLRRLRDHLWLLEQEIEDAPRVWRCTWADDSGAVYYEQVPDDEPRPIRTLGCWLGP